jgi:hypothetical protein
LDTEAITVRCVLLANLGCVVEVFLGLDGTETRTFDGLDLVEPFATSGTNVCFVNQSTNLGNGGQSAKSRLTSVHHST